MAGRIKDPVPRATSPGHGEASASEILVYLFETVIVDVRLLHGLEPINQSKRILAQMEDHHSGSIAFYAIQAVAVRDDRGPQGAPSARATAGRPDRAVSAGAHQTVQS